MKYISFLCFLMLQASLFKISNFAQNLPDINLLIKEKKYPEAEKMIAKRMVEETNRDSLFFYKGVIFYLKDSNFEEAVTCFEKSIDLNPKNSNYYLWHAKTLGKIAKKGGIFGQVNTAGKVKKSLEKAIELDDKNFEAFYLLVAFHMVAPGIAGGDQEVATKIAREYEKFDINRANILWAVIYKRQRSLDDYLEFFGKIQPPEDEISKTVYRDSFLNDLFDEIVYLLSKNNVENASKLVSMCIKKFPNSPIGYWGYGRILVEEKKYDEAIANFEKAISVDDNFKSAYYRLGVTYQLKGEREKAVSYLTKFLTLESDKGAGTVKDAEKRIEQLKK